MIRLFRPAYESEATQFLHALKADRPYLEQQQAEGRSRLWDKAPVPLEDQQRSTAAKAAQPAYVYQQMPVLRESEVRLAPESQLALAEPKA